MIREHRLARGLATAMLCACALACAGPAAAALTADAAGRLAAQWCERELAADWRRPEVDTFEPGAVLHQAGRWTVHVSQRWQGLAIVPLDVCVTLDEDGRVLRHLGLPLRSPEPAGREVLRGGVLLQRARAIAGTRTDAGASVERVIASTPDGPRRAWRVRFEAIAPPAPQAVVIDAERGELLASEGEPRYAVGNVYPKDPRDALVEVPITGLEGDGRTLRGERLHMLNGSLPEPTAPDGDFRIVPTAPDTTRFDEVNAYWHARSYLDWLAARGYPGLSDTMRVRVHANIAPNTAFTVGHWVFLSDTTTGYSRDIAKAADVSAHEFSHVIQNSLGLVSGSGESIAMLEGLADYLCAAFTNDPAVGEWVYVRYPGGVTTVASDPSVFRYGNYNHVHYGGVADGSWWANGMILSGALWDLRAAIGDAADSLVLEAMPRMPHQGDFGDFEEGMFSADLDLHGGRLRGAISDAMSRRELLPSVYASLLGPDSLHQGEPGTFRIVGSASAVPDSTVWSVYRASQLFPPYERIGIGFGSTFAYADSVPFDVVSQTPDGHGGVLTGRRRVGMKQVNFGINGPRLLPRGLVDTFFLTATEAIDTTSVRWWVRRYCDTPPCAPGPTQAGRTWFTHGDTLDFDVVADARSLWGFAVRESIKVSVRRPKVTINGPRSFTTGMRQVFTAVASGLGPWSYGWEVQGSDGIMVPVGDQSQVDLGMSNNYGIFVRVTDGQGRQASTSAYVVRNAARTRGPSHVTANRPGQFWVSMDYGDTLLTPTWSVRRWCTVAPCVGASWLPLGTGFGVDHALTYDEQVRVVVTGPGGFRCADSMIVLVDPPVAMVTLSGTNSFAGTRTFDAGAAGAAPLAVTWFLRTGGAPSDLTPLGSGPSVSLTQSPPFQIVASVEDVNHRVGRDSLVVAPDSTWFGAARSGVGVACTAIVSDQVTLSVWAPNPCRARLTVYDVAGRTIATWYDGMFGGGTRVRTLSTRDLRSGVYFCRWEAGGATASSRFVVVK